MTKKMLIDATHAEETRVAVVDGGRLVEFDYESAFRKPLKGNIYLAKVTRVEPSLQAAFVNFGGNRHGFLPFSEIHPDYFRIPIADREALMAEQEAALRRAEEAEARAEAEDEKLLANEAAAGAAGDGVEEIVDDRESVEEIGGDLALDAKPGNAKPGAKRAAEDAKTTESDDLESDGEDDDIGNRAENDDAGEAEDEDESRSGDEAGDEDGDDEEDEDEINGNAADGDEDEINGNIAGESTHEGSAEGERNGRERGGSGRFRRGRGRRGRSMAHDSRRVEKVSREDVDEEQRFRFNLRRKYKIQEVIKRGQIMLVQVSKEERGNKGAAVGTYLSLPGRYCVLMPNSPRGGGVSRKIANYKDRAHMREIMKDLDVPKGMSVILRTAGVSRTKAEIKRDLDYLMRLWDGIRELTLESTAPALVYEEANLVKRAVRDLYSRDIDEVHVAGEEGFKTARDFMKKLTPSHVKKVIEFKDQPAPLFNHHKIEGQIAEIGEPQVTLPSGGYIVINPTEALVSIDVNSGKATKERHIEETALRTNLEAADEVARQLRLRDLGGLIVVDFIDMEDRRNNAKLERRMREALSTDRARIQMGRISSFGLMELSRQRMSPSLTESQFEVCSHCHGVGRVRTSDAASILVLRAIEDEGLKGRASQVIAHMSESVALYIMNHKRRNLADLEQRYGMSVLLRVDDTLGAAGFRVEAARGLARDAENGDDDDDPAPERAESPAPRARGNGGEDGQDERSAERGERGGRRRGRRGGRRRGGGREENAAPGGEDENTAESGDFVEKPEREDANGDTGPGNDNRHDGEQPDTVDAPDKPPRRKRGERGPRTPRRKDEGNSGDGDNGEAAAKPAAAQAVAAEPAPAREEKPARQAATGSRQAAAPVKSQEYEVITESSASKKKGWWNRLVE